MIPVAIQADIEKNVGTKILNATPLGGGCIHHAHRLDTTSQTYFVKWNRPSQSHNFSVELKGLNALAETQTFSVPQQYHFGQLAEHSYLLLEYIAPTAPAPDYWEHFGRSLAQLHQYSHAQFGLAYDNYIGALPQANQPHENWSEFFASQRILPLAGQALRKGLLGKQLLDRIERLVASLANFFPEEPPALIHGDLWGGNILSGGAGYVHLIDPAVYYAHREIELAFMTMFDRQPPRFYDAYQEVYPLEQDWATRLELYNLYPYLVHVNLFGASYVSGVDQIVSRYL